VKRALVGLAVLVALALGALLIAPSFVDLNPYKERIAAEVSRATGRTVAIDGTIALQLLPTPHVRLTDVRIGNIEGALAPDMAQVAALDASVALGPLFGGSLQVTTVTLLAPVITLERLADGRANWVFATTEGEGEAEGDGATVRFDSIAIEDGTLIVRDEAAGRTVQADAIDLTARAASLQGPFEAEGSLVVAGSTLGFKGRVGALDREAVSVAVELEVGEDAHLGFAGQVTTGAAFAVSGTLDGSGPSLARALGRAGLGTALPAALDGAFTLGAAIAATEAGASLTDVSATLDEVRASGAFELVFGAPTRLDGVIAVNRLDLDALLGPATGGADATPATPSDGPLVPVDLAGDLSVTVDAVVLRGEVVQQARLDASFGDGVVTIQQGGALLPGGSDLALFGVAERRDGEPRFDGRVEIASDNLRTLLAWVGVAPGDVPADRLRRFGLVSPIVATPGHVTLDGLDLRLDTSRVTGRLDAALGDAPAIGADLAIDKLNLDAYLPESSGGAGGAPPANLTLDLTLAADQITYRGQNAQGVTVAARLAGGQVAVERFAARDLAGAAVAFDGALDPLAPRYDGTLTVAGKDLSGLARVAGLDPTWRLDALGAVKLEARVQGGAGPVDLNATMTSGALDARVTGTVDMATTNLDVAYDATVSDMGGALVAFGIAAPAALANAGIGRVHGTYKGGATGGEGALAVEGPFGTADLKGRLDAAANPLTFDVAFAAKGASRDAALGLLGVASLGADGAYDLSGTAKGSLDAVTLDATLGTAGATATAKGTVTGLAASPAYDLTLAVDHPDMDGMMAALGRPPTGAAGPFALDLKVKGDQTRVGTETLTATLGPARLTGSVGAALDRDVPFVEATLESGDLVLDPFLGGGGEAPAGAERWSREPMALDALEGIEGRARLDATSLTFGAIRLEQAVLEASLAGGVLTVERFDGRVFDGALAMRGSLAPGELHGLDATVTLTDVDARAALAQTAGYQDLGGRLDVEARLESLGVSEAELVGNLAGDAKVNLREGVIDGYDLTAINQRLSNLDNVVDFAGLLGTSLQGGSTPIQRADGTFTIQKGVAESNDLTALMDGAEAFGTAIIDLPDWEMDVVGEARLLGHSESPPLGVTMRGALDAPKTKFDTGALEAFVAKRAVGAAIQQFGDEQTKDLFGIVTGQPSASTGAQPGLEPGELAPPDSTTLEPAPEAPAADVAPELFDEPALESAPAEPVLVEPEPEPVLVEPEPVEPEVIEPELAEPAPAEPVLPEPELVEPEPAEPVLVEPEPTEPVLAEPEPVEPLPEDSGELPEPALPESGDVSAEQQLLDNLLQGQ
jgi:uncharacterized protein involved in outer membrane biogenesis